MTEADHRARLQYNKQVLKERLATLSLLRNELALNVATMRIFATGLRNLRETRSKDRDVLVRCDLGRVNGHRHDVPKRLMGPLKDYHLTLWEEP